MADPRLLLELMKRTRAAKRAPSRMPSNPSDEIMQQRADSAAALEERQRLERMGPVRRPLSDAELNAERAAKRQKADWLTENDVEPTSPVMDVGGGAAEDLSRVNRASLYNANDRLTPELAKTSDSIAELQDLLRRYDAGLATGNPDDAAMQLSIAKGSRKGQLEDALRRTAAGEGTKPDLTPGSLEEALYEMMMQKNFRPLNRPSTMDEVMRSKPPKGE